MRAQIKAGSIRSNDVRSKGDAYKKELFGHVNVHKGEDTTSADCFNCGYYQVIFRLFAGIFRVLLASKQLI